MEKKTAYHLTRCEKEPGLSEPVVCTTLEGVRQYLKDNGYQDVNLEVSLIGWTGSISNKSREVMFTINPISVYM